MHMKQIKITKIDGGVIYTRINGTEKEIIEHYNACNFWSGEEHTQIKEIEIILNGSDFAGCRQRKIVYPFTYNKKAECYLY